LVIANFIEIYQEKCRGEPKMFDCFFLKIQINVPFLKLTTAFLKQSATSFFLPQQLITLLFFPNKLSSPAITSKTIVAGQTASGLGWRHVFCYLTLYKRLLFFSDLYSNLIYFICKNSMKGQHRFETSNENTRHRI